MACTAHQPVPGGMLELRYEGPGRGYGLVASQHMQPGTTLLQEKQPIAVVVPPSPQPHACHACLAFIAPTTRGTHTCSACSHAHWCSSRCLEKSSSMHAVSGECWILQQHTIPWPQPLPSLPTAAAPAAAAPATREHIPPQPQPGETHGSVVNAQGRASSLLSALAGPLVNEVLLALHLQSSMQLTSAWAPSHPLEDVSTTSNSSSAHANVRDGASGSMDPALEPALASHGQLLSAHLAAELGAEALHQLLMLMARAAVWGRLSAQAAAEAQAAAAHATTSTTSNSSAHKESHEASQVADTVSDCCRQAQPRPGEAVSNQAAPQPALPSAYHAHVPRTTQRTSERWEPVGPRPMATITAAMKLEAYAVLLVQEQQAAAAIQTCMGTEADMPKQAHENIVRDMISQVQAAESVAQEVLCRVLANAIEVGCMPAGAVGLPLLAGSAAAAQARHGAPIAIYRHASRLQHSCRPNAAYHSVNGTSHLVLRSLTQLQPGQAVTIAYIDTALPLSRRRQELQYKYCFQCRCERCQEENDHQKDRDPSRQRAVEGMACCAERNTQADVDKVLDQAMQQMQHDEDPAACWGTLHGWLMTAQTRGSAGVLGQQGGSDVLMLLAAAARAAARVAPSSDLGMRFNTSKHTNNEANHTTDTSTSISTSTDMDQTASISGSNISIYNISSSGGDKRRVACTEAWMHAVGCSCAAACLLELRLLEERGLLAHAASAWCDAASTACQGLAALLHAHRSTGTAAQLAAQLTAQLGCMRQRPEAAISVHNAAEGMEKGPGEETLPATKRQRMCMEHGHGDASATAAGGSGSESGAHGSNSGSLAACQRICMCVEAWSSVVQLSVLLMQGVLPLTVWQAVLPPNLQHLVPVHTSGMQLTPALLPAEHAPCATSAGGSSMSSTTHPSTHSLRPVQQPCSHTIHGQSGDSKTNTLCNTVSHKGVDSSLHALCMTLPYILARAHSLLVLLYGDGVAASETCYFLPFSLGLPYGLAAALTSAAARAEAIAVA